MSTEATTEPQAAEKPAEEKAAATETPAPKKTKAELQAEQLAEVDAEIEDAWDRHDDANAAVIEYSAELKEAKKRLAGANADLAMFRREKKYIQSGILRPQLFPKPRREKKADEEVQAEDPADAADLAELIEFGVTSKQIEALTESQLAKEQPLKTVGDLFRAIAADQWWFKKVKGLGEQKRDALINATIAYREKFPVPDGDTRQKQCKDCDTLYPQAVGECPQCQSPYFNLTELAAAEQADPANEEQEAAAE